MRKYETLIFSDETNLVPRLAVLFTTLSSFPLTCRYKIVINNLNGRKRYLATIIIIIIHFPMARNY